ncbi:MAG: flagellar basal-body rod protein FlgG [Dethiobacter sp.]|jgi:flagellar basal-body rod protein FlgG|nr:MAG: flagellar basal-body rod protein FlgG [Dethiobacter sp.]
MIRKLWNSATGMLAQSFKIDTIANNVANVNTTGFKKKSVLFQDLMYRSLRGPGNPVAPNEEGKLLVGQGVKPAAIKTYFLPGVLRETGIELDMAIQGEGFFRILLPDGRESFTRVGGFSLDPTLNLVTEDGYLVDLLPQELAGREFTSISIDSNGTVRLYNDAGEVTREGETAIYRFQNPEGLEAIGRNLWLATENSGEPLRGRPEDEGFGAIKQKFLEQSNVSMVEEMTSLILAQRAYEISSRAVRTADEMWALANQIRK